MTWVEGVPDHDGLLTTLYQLYIYDLNQNGGGFQLDAAGRWQPDYLDYWREALHGQSPGARVGLWMVDGWPAGFALHGERGFAHMSDEVDFHLAEFFVRANFRGTGQAAAMARRLFGDRPGRWELAVLDANEPAVSFWQKLLPGVGRDLVCLDRTPGHRVYRFTVDG